MFDNFVKIHFSPEVQEVLFDSLSFLERMNIHDHVPFLQAVLDTDFDCKEDKFCFYIIKTLREFALSLGIRLTDCTFKEMLTVVVSFTALEEYENSEEITRVLDSEETDIDKLACLLSIVSGKEVETIYPILDGVESSVMRNLAKLHKTEETLEIVGPSQLAELKTYALYLELIEYSSKLSGIVPGMEYSWYARTCEDIINSYAVEDLLFIILLSSDYFPTPLLSFDKLSEYWFTDLVKLEQVRNKFKIHLSNYLAFKSTAN